MASRGRPSGRYTQAQRLVKIVEMLQTRPNLTIRMLTDEFDISRRTAHRDLATLKETRDLTPCGRQSDNNKIWRLTESTQGETLRLTVLEMAALVIGRNLFNFMDGTSIKGAIDTLYIKIAHRLASGRASHRQRLNTKLYCTPGSPKDYSGKDAQLNEILTGILEEQQVKITQTGKDGSTKTVIIDPLSLVVHQNALYLIARFQGTEEPQVVAMESIGNVRWLRGNDFDYPDDFNPEKFLGSAFGVSRGKTESILLRIDSDMLTFFEQRRWHTSQKITSKSDGSAEVSLEMTLSPELTSWILSFGDKMEVLAPQKLRADIALLAKRMHAIYLDLE